MNLPSDQPDSPSRLVVFYDDACELCRRCRRWLEHQSTHVPLEFVAVGSGDLDERHRADLPWLGEELVVVDEAGRGWVGPAAFLLCLWATVDHRQWAYRLSGSNLSEVAERFFEGLSAHRSTISALLRRDECIGGTCPRPGNGAS